MSALLSVSDAHVSYGKVEAVRSVSLDVADNEIVTIIGANGAGKTTLLNAIMGVLPLKGGAAFAGEDMAPLDIEDRVAAGLSLVPEHRELFGTMNVEDNLELGAFRIPKATAARSFEKVYTLFPRRTARGRRLGAAGRAERASRPEDCRPRLCHGARRVHPERTGERYRRQPAGRGELSRLPA
jgi:branched-chain amino acid transport system ATP-binding protein